ncbi:filamentous hemagglutinin [Brasilonema octagenarum UFV-E1]|uniref:Filamentous hemagglutinin n=2 Tax=Brasilonema TaxID=383614 RepID=A0A856MNC4_9CYAN|nr:MULTISPECIES: S-layer family protein [Brasilonema]NMF63034.1 filamentous hemagglutinin [Brasilonema octagenarum UFV-OR1]QDL10737.1 filamentous hemagglutinin [Brasilonema sennae CENA114]QDL17081.1 filamentous hemagglutinin [Brasilonema octagenarum UFV-E1]
MKLFPIILLINGSIFINLLASHSTQAQIVPDTTLPENSVVTIQDKTIQIDGGTRVGNNLFHSFEKFSVPTGDTAFFNNIKEIRNILSRITGNSISEINGIIKANNAANLFLINPNGIIFGSNAQLDIGGSFLASTASSIIFADGFKFNTSATQTKPLLTISAPIGLGFGEMPKSIVNRSIVNSDDDLIGLRVAPNQTLALVGGDVLIEGGYLSTKGGRIELGSVAGNNVVSLTPIDQGWVLGYEGIQNFQDINLSQAAFVVSDGDSSGDIQIQGRRVTLTEGSQVAVIARTEGQAGNLTVKGSELLKLEGNSVDAGFDFSVPTLLFNDVYGKATGEQSKLTLETERLIVKNGAQISAGNYGAGRGVNLKISASEVQLEGAFIDADKKIPSGLFARVQENATGNGGTLTIETKKLTVKNGAQVSTETLGSGHSGNLEVNASESIELIGTIPGINDPSALFAGVKDKATATGNGGNLTINTGQLIIKDGAQIATTAQNQGQGGILTIKASDFILLSGNSPLAEFRGKGRSGIFVSAEPALKDELGNSIITTANAGDLKITTGELTVEKGAIISADNFGIGKGANVTLNVNRLIIQAGGQIGAGSLLEKDAVNNQRGSGGTLTVNASESVKVVGTGTIGSSSQQVPSSLLTQAEGTGNAGDLNIFTPNFTVKDGAEINLSATGLGEAGNLQVEANSVRLNHGTINAATANGEGGNINLQVKNILLMQDNSLISAQASNNANGGNINIDAGFVIAFPNQNNDIIAKAERGDGGNIKITTQAIFGLEERNSNPQNSTNDIDASSEFGLDGSVFINTPDIDPTRGLVQLPVEPVNVQVAQGCQTTGTQTAGKQSSLASTGKGGLAINPYEPLSSSNIWEDVPVSTQTGTSRQRESVATVPDKIVEAQGWVINEKGEVFLVAEDSRCSLR